MLDWRGSHELSEKMYIKSNKKASKISYSVFSDFLIRKSNSWILCDQSINEYGIKEELSGIVTIHSDGMNKYQDVGENRKLFYGLTEILEAYSNNNENIDYYDYGFSSLSSIKKFMDYELKKRSNLSIIGINRPDFVDLQNNDIIITEGRTFTQEEINNGEKVILIDKDYLNTLCNRLDEDEKKVCKLEVKNYEIGEKIEISNVILEYPWKVSFEDEDKELYYESEEYEIIGFFYINNNEDTNNFGQTNGLYVKERYVDVYMPLKTMENLIDKSQSLLSEYQALYPDKRLDEEMFYKLKYLYVKPVNNEILSNVKNELNKAYFEGGYSDLLIQSSSDAFELISGPVESLSEISFIVILISAFVSIIILALVTTIFIRDRKHEMGIYLSMGERKINIFLQIFLEVFAVGMLAVTLSFSSGLVLGQKITDHILEIGNEKQEQIYKDELEALGSVNVGNLTIEDVSEEVKLEFDMEYIVVVYGVFTLIITLSTIMPMVYILKLDPKKIML